jgi:hypothetical protein
MRQLHSVALREHLVREHAAAFVSAKPAPQTSLMRALAKLVK